MLKYLFSHEVLAKQFVDITQSHNIDVQLVEKNKDWEITIEVELDDLIIVQLNDCFAELTRQDQEMFCPKKLQKSQPMLKDAIEISLQSGGTFEVDINQDILNKLLYVLSLDELNILINNIAKAIDNQEIDTGIDQSMLSKD